MRSAEGRSTFSADGSVTFPVLPLHGKRRSERMLTIRDGLVSDARCGSYRPWAPDGYRYEGEPVHA